MTAKIRPIAIFKEMTLTISERPYNQDGTSEPRVRNFPTEIFGHHYMDHSEEAKTCLKDQYCPYLGGTCKKPRKSEPHIKVGICSVGYKGFLDQFKPIIICPHRFLEDEIFESLTRVYLSGWQSVEWVSEVNIKVGGNVDFVAIDKRRDSDTITDFLCVEFQAAGTTGTPWQAVLEFKNNRRYSKDVYKYGINWANEFMKTMMQQVYKKGYIVRSWGRKIVFIVQDVAIDYLKSAVDTSQLHDFNDRDEIHFMTFKLAWMNDKWGLQFNNIVCSNVEGIGKILGGAHSDLYPTEEDFKNSILLKGKKDGIFQPPRSASS